MQPYRDRFAPFSRPVPLKHIATAADFNRKRRHNALRLKNTFDSIIDRYSQDFTEVGDIIDLRTEKLVVDNGHLENLRGELDPAYDQVWVGASDSEDGEEDMIEDNEDIDELCSDMMTVRETPSGKFIERKTSSPPKDIDTRTLQEQDHSQNFSPKSYGDQVIKDQSIDPLLHTHTVMERNEKDPSRQPDQFAVHQLLPPTINNGQLWQQPLTPQLETAVQSMTALLQQQMMAVLGAVLPPQTSSNHLKNRLEKILPTTPIFSRKREHLCLDEPRIESLPKNQPVKKRRIFELARRRASKSQSVSVDRNPNSAMRLYPLQPQRKTPSKRTVRQSSRESIGPTARSSLLLPQDKSQPPNLESTEELLHTEANCADNFSSEDELSPEFTSTRASLATPKPPSPQVVIMSQPRYNNAEDLRDRLRGGRQRILSLSSIPHEDDDEDDIALIFAQPADVLEPVRPPHLSPEMHLEKPTQSRPTKYGQEPDSQSPPVPLLSLTFGTNSRQSEVNRPSQSGCSKSLKPSTPVKRKGRGRPRKNPIGEV